MTLHYTASDQGLDGYAAYVDRKLSRVPPTGIEVGFTLPSSLFSMDGQESA